jgi:hypothetical protein
MRPEELLKILRRKPFRPIRICTTDGAAFEILHPDQVLVYASKIEIALDPNPRTGVWGRSEYLAPLHVARVEELEASAAGGAG